MQIRIKCVDDPVEPDDGQRLLVDRLWPRGLTRDEASLDSWLREVAPGNALRRWCGHDRRKWAEFRRRYRAELALADRQAALEDLVEGARRGRVTLLCAARDLEHSNAAVLGDLLQECAGDP